MRESNHYSSRENRVNFLFNLIPMIVSFQGAFSIFFWRRKDVKHSFLLCLFLNFVLHFKAYLYISTAYTLEMISEIFISNLITVAHIGSTVSTIIIIIIIVTSCTVGIGYASKRYIKCTKASTSGTVY